MAPILNQAGGLRYHFRALRHAGQNWAPFRNAVGSWLQEALPAESPLLLVAPSGGYCLSPAYLLSRRAPIHAIDWDPLAPFFFRRSHPKLQVHWHQKDLIQAGGQALEQLLKLHPDASILFCNFLGQAQLASPKGYPRFAARLPGLLKGRHWASFHDRYSGAICPSRAEPWTCQEHRASSEELIHTFYSSSQSGELNEHALPGLPESPEYRYWIWQLTPKAYHLIEGMSSYRNQSPIGFAEFPRPSDTSP